VQSFAYYQARKGMTLPTRLETASRWAFSSIRKAMGAGNFKEMGEQSSLDQRSFIFKDIHFAVDGIYDATNGSWKIWTIPA
jgi:hypothetical protein